MYFELKENKPHGTKDDPFSTYHIENAGRSFQIPVHWHDEFEIIYVRSGFLTVSISGESYIGKQEKRLWCRRAICILWDHRAVRWIIIPSYFR